MGLDTDDDEAQAQGSLFNNDKKDGQKSTSKTPVLDNFGRDLTKLAELGKLDPIIGRKDEIERVVQILTRRKKNNPILIGEPGCVFEDTQITVRKVSDESAHSFILKE
jgi:ATP-dependent Clp protease ATP-binding subunit ClpC